VVLTETALLILPHSDVIVVTVTAAEMGAPVGEKVDACKFPAQPCAGGPFRWRMARFWLSRGRGSCACRGEMSHNLQVNSAADSLQIAQGVKFDAILDCEIGSTRSGTMLG
jgi:hypothetical protein